MKNKKGRQYPSEYHRKLLILLKWLDENEAEKVYNYCVRLLKRANVDVETIFHAERSIRKNLKLLKLLAKY